MRTLAAPVGDLAVFVGILVKRERAAVDRVAGIANRFPPLGAAEAQFLRVVWLEPAHAANLAVRLAHDVLVPSVLSCTCTAIRGNENPGHSCEKKAERPSIKKLLWPKTCRAVLARGPAVLVLVVAYGALQAIVGRVAVVVPVDEPRNSTRQ